MSDKACRSCRQWKPYTEFSKDSTHGDGYSSWCKECRGRSHLEWRKKNLEANKEKKKQYYYENRTRILSQRNVARNGARYLARLRQEVYNHYGNKCYCCGLDDPRFLTVEHLSNDGCTVKHKGGKRVSGTTMYKGIIENGFPVDIALACYNCNCGRSKHGQGGICPHRQSLPLACRKETFFIDLAEERINSDHYQFPSYVPDEIRHSRIEILEAEWTEKSRREVRGKQPKRRMLKVDKLIKLKS
jgi:hypothetical protein